MLFKLTSCFQSSLELKMEDFLNAQKNFVPLALRDIPLTKGETTWSDKGGKKDCLYPLYLCGNMT